MKEFFKTILSIGLVLCFIYFGLLAITVTITILINLNHLGFAICLFILMLIMGWLYSLIDSL